PISYFGHQRCGDDRANTRNFLRLPISGAQPGKLHCTACGPPVLARLVTMPRSARACPSACSSIRALAPASSPALACLAPRASCSRRKCWARWRRFGFAGVDVARDLRAALRASFSISARVFATVLRLTLASFARSVVEASGSALSAASARSRASLGALRRYLRLRRPPRARLLDDRRREGCDSKTAGGVSALRRSGASAPRTAAAVFDGRLRAARLVRTSVRSDAGSMGATPAVEGGSAHDKSADGDV